MDTIADMWPYLRDGFQLTIVLFLCSAVIATIVGIVLASMRVSPVLPFRIFGTGYVNIFRNTPLLVLFLLFVEGLPAIDARPKLPALGLDVFETLAIMALSVYTASFVCESVRSGVNTVDAGQAEAARSIGMTFGLSLRLIVLPQATRAVIPPLTSTYIALLKNTAIASAFGVTEATYQQKKMSDQTVAGPYVIFLALAFGYVILVWIISGISNYLERRVAVAR